jgi:hypothetical protein
MTPTDDGKQISTLLNVESSRAFPNLFEVLIDTNTNSLSDINTKLTSLLTTSRVKKVTFEGSFGNTMEYNEAIQNFIIKGPDRIKGITLTFKENSTYDLLSIFKDWLNKIYDFINHYYFAGVNPTGTIKISLNDNHTHAGVLIVEDAIPKSLSYPSYDWSENNPIELEVSFSCGHMYFDTSARYVGAL